MVVVKKDKPIQRLDVWSGEFDGEDGKQYTVLRGLKADWGDGKPLGAGYQGEPGPPSRVLHDTFNFTGNKKLDWLDVYSPNNKLGCVDSLRFHLPESNDYFSAGGFGGDWHHFIEKGQKKELDGFDVTVKAMGNQGEFITELTPALR